MGVEHDDVPYLKIDFKQTVVAPGDKAIVSHLIFLSGWLCISVIRYALFMQYIFCYMLYVTFLIIIAAKRYKYCMMGHQGKASIWSF